MGLGLHEGQALATRWDATLPSRDDLAPACGIVIAIAASAVLETMLEAARRSRFAEHPTGAIVGVERVQFRAALPDSH
jgi:hypothetical protein